MTVRRSVLMWLLFAASFVSGIVATHPVRAQAFSTYVTGDAPVRVSHSPTQRGVVIRRLHYVPLADDRFDPAPPTPISADVLPTLHEDADEPSITLMPQTVHYVHSPIGLDDSPTTMGFVAKF